MLQKIIQFGVCCILAAFIGAAIGIFTTTEPGKQSVKPGETGEQLVTPQQQWESWLRVYKGVLGYDVLSTAASEAWIEKHKDEIHIPDQIEFGKPHVVMELHLMTYQIRIAVDPDGNRRVAAWERPPEKTLLKRGDKIPPSFVNQHQQVHFEWKGHLDNLREFEEAYEEHLKNITYKYVLQAKFPAWGNDTYTYTSLKGATIHYNTDRIITHIEGTVFKRRY